jgi:hypothetical protein
MTRKMLMRLFQKSKPVRMSGLTVKMERSRKIFEKQI